jgi:hypothetical protein
MLYISPIIQCKGVKVAVCLVSIFIKNFCPSMFLNNNLRVWPSKYVFRLININTYIQSKTIYVIQQYYMFRSIRPTSSINALILK